MRLVLGLVSILGLWISPSTSRPGTDNDLFVEVSYPAENFNSLRAASYKASLSDPVSKICDIFNCANNVTDAVCCNANFRCMAQKDEASCVYKNGSIIQQKEATGFCKEQGKSCYTCCFDDKCNNAQACS